MRKILIVTTSHTAMPHEAAPTGVWYEELAGPYYAFVDAGHAVTIASIRGGVVPIDPRSLVGEAVSASVRRFQDDPEALAAARQSQAVADLDARDYDALFLAGGHGTMWDFPDNAALGRTITDALDAGRIVAAVCHGPAGFIGVRRADGAPLVAGRSIACFTDSEERAVHLDDQVPFLLATRLASLGARLSAGPDFQPQVVTDGTLMTGQSPNSAVPLAASVNAAMRAAPPRVARPAAA